MEVYQELMLRARNLRERGSDIEHFTQEERDSFDATSRELYYIAGRLEETEQINPSKN